MSPQHWAWDAELKERHAFPLLFAPCSKDSIHSKTSPSSDVALDERVECTGNQGDGWIETSLKRQDPDSHDVASTAAKDIMTGLEDAVESEIVLANNFSTRLRIDLPSFLTLGTLGRSCRTNLSLYCVFCVWS